MPTLGRGMVSENFRSLGKWLDGDVPFRLNHLATVGKRTDISSSDFADWDISSNDTDVNRRGLACGISCRIILWSIGNQPSVGGQKICRLEFNFKFKSETK